MNRPALLSRTGTLLALLALVLPAVLLASEEPIPKAPPAEGGDHEDFEREALPILRTYCFGCHGPEEQKGSVRFDEVDPDMIHGPDAELWDYALDLLGAGDMPPQKAPQPTAEERRALVNWIRSSLTEAARAQEEPVPAVLRRMNRAQYTNALQDLLGLSIDFGQVLPDDGKSHMGFSNNGEVLLSSPLHLEYYQAIAREALDQAIVVGEIPEVAHYRVSFGKGSGAGLPAARTGGYQSVPLSPDDFTVDILDRSGRPRVGASEEEMAELDRIKTKVTVGLRGSSQDRFHSVEEGVVLYSALPHKEVAPGAWQGPSPNMKLEMQRVFPDKGDFVMRVQASRGFLVSERRELLVSLDDPEPRVTLEPGEVGREPTAEELLAMQATSVGPWYQAGPIFTSTGDAARDTVFTPRADIDFDEVLGDGETRWEQVKGATDGKVQRYETKIGALLLARVLEAPTSRTMDISIGSDDAVFVWLNGEPVLEADVRRGVKPDQNFLSLDLQAGRNELLIKVVNHGGGFGSYHRIVHDGALAGVTPYHVLPEATARVATADRTEGRENLAFDKGGLVAKDFPAQSRARLLLDIEPGYYQFDLVHPALPTDSMGSIRFEVAEQKLDLRPEPTAEELEMGFRVTPIGAGYLNGGAHEFLLGGPFFVGFSHLVLTPLEEDHPLVARLEAQEEQQESAQAPALRAYIGTRTDDGMDYRTFDRPRTVEAQLGESETFVFQGRLENLPIPEPESGDDEILSGICVLGIWNDHLVKSRKETGPPLLVEAIEFEAPYHPVWPPVSHTRIFFDSPHKGDLEAYTREVVTAFLERALRRRAAPDEIARYMDHWREVRGGYEVYEHGVREVLVAILCSPSFLFLTEPADLRDEQGRIGEELLASRLSFFLWNTPPDEELHGLAREGLLRESIDQQVERLLDDPRSERFVRAFAREWLRLDRLEGMTINPNRFPAFTRFVKRDMAEETYRFFDHVLREDLDLFELVDSDFAMLNQNLAEFYGIEGVQGVDFRPVPLDRQLGRGGLLSQGAFLAGHSDGNEPHPIKRAVWVKEKLLGQPPLPPPPNVPDLDPTVPGFEEMTLKERIEAHRDNPSCFDCHAALDPFGIALEGYSAVGLLEEKRKGKAIDASVVLPDGTEVEGAVGLKAYILDQVPELFAGSLIEHLFAYALGRDVGFRDEEELQGIRETVRSQGDSMRAVIHAIVASPSFLER